MSLITAEEYLAKYRVTAYRIVLTREQPNCYRVWFYEPLIAHWQTWGDFPTLWQAEWALRRKHKNERRWVKIAKRQGMAALREDWTDSPILYQYKDKKENE